MGALTKRQFVWLAAGATVLLLALPQYRSRIATLPVVLQLVQGDRAGREADGALQGRLTEMWAAMLVFADHPIAGVGPGRFRE